MAAALNTGAVSVTSEVFTVSDIKYVVRVNGEPCVFFDTELDAISSIRSIAINESQRYEGPKTKVFLRHGNNEIDICTQTPGYLFAGQVKVEVKIDITPVARAIFVQRPSEIIEDTTYSSVEVPEGAENGLSIGDEPAMEVSEVELL